MRNKEFSHWDQWSEWLFTNGYQEVSLKLTSQLYELNLHSVLCRRRLSMSNIPKKKWHSCYNALVNKIFLILWKNGFQILLGSQCRNWLSLKVLNNLPIKLKKKHQQDSKIGITNLLLKMRNYHLSGRSLTNSFSRNCLSLESWDQIVSQLHLTTSSERHYLSVMIMLTAMQHQVLPKFLRHLTLTLHLWLQSTSYCHLELILSQM